MEQSASALGSKLSHSETLQSSEDERASPHTTPQKEVRFEVEAEQVMKNKSNIPNNMLALEVNNAYERTK